MPKYRDNILGPSQRYGVSKISDATSPTGSVQPTSSSTSRNRSGFPSSPDNQPASSLVPQSSSETLAEAEAMPNAPDNPDAFNTKPFQLKRLVENMSVSDAPSSSIKTRGKSSSKRRSHKTKNLTNRTIDDFYVSR